MLAEEFAAEQIAKWPSPEGRKLGANPPWKAQRLEPGTGAREKRRRETMSDDEPGLEPEVRASILSPNLFCRQIYFVARALHIVESILSPNLLCLQIFSVALSFTFSPDIFFRQIYFVAKYILLRW